MLEIIKKRKKEISRFMDDYVMNIDELQELEWEKDIDERLLKITKEGKMVRGTLIIETFNAFSEEDRELLKAASAIELAHTGLLIDDDIVDKDDYRRGLPAVHKQYQRLAEEEGFQQPYHYGVSMALCLSDVAYFLAFKLLADMDLEEGKIEAMNIFWENFSAVGLAEMTDIHSGFSDEEMTEEEIMKLYEKKTANYTFSLPMILGATLAGRHDLKEDLESIGNKIGLIYQMKDDELGLLGEEDEVGKPSGSDLEENKKTLHRLYLLQELDEREEEFREMLGEDITEEQKALFIEELEKHGIKQKVERKMDELQTELETELERTGLPDEFEEKLKALTEFCRERNI